MLKENEKIPLNIAVKDIDGNEIFLSKYIGKYLIIYFYPKDDTPGCTLEACEFRDYNYELESIGAKVIAISKDKIKSHQKFKSKYNLNFNLLSDENHILQDAFGVWTEKKFMGKIYLGTQRSTFLINPQGEIIKVWINVKPEGHAEEVYNELVQILKNK